MNQFELMRSRRFLPLFMVQFLGAFNDNVFRFALIIFITFQVAATGNLDAKSLVVISGGIFIAPFFLFSSLAGQYADKFEKSVLIRRLKSVEILVVCIAGAAFWSGDTVFLLSVLFLMGTQSTFFGPLKYGILPQHLNEQELTGGNGLIQMGTYVAILLGGVAGGFLAAETTFGPLPVVAALITIAVAGRLCAQAIPAAPAADPTIVINWNLANATVRLLKRITAERDVLVLVLLISWFWFVGATLLSMVPTYGKDLLNADERAVTLLNLAFTLGIGIGSLLCERFSRKRIELGLMPYAAVGMSVCAADVWLAGIAPLSPQMLSVSAFFTHPPALRIFVDLVLIGGCGAIFIVPLYAALQARVDFVVRSRVIAALNVTNALFMVFSALFTFALYQYKMTIPDIFGCVALLNVIIALTAASALPEFARRARSLLLRRNNG